jgi:16S rRNA (guanine527-N7)-methyltransferase
VKNRVASASLAEHLAAGVEMLGIPLHTQQQQQLLTFLALLAKWNAVYNLSAIRDPYQMLVQHLLDSLAIVPHLAALSPTTVLDAGSGGGLPGVVLAVAQPDWQITLNDVIQKKTAFLTQVKATLPLPNVTIVSGHVQKLQPGIDIDQRFDAVVSRALAHPADCAALLSPLIAPGGTLWAMVGAKPETTALSARIEQAADMQITRIIALDIPFLDASRHLLQINALQK